MMSDLKKKTAVVLGGTVPHGELIKKLQDRGYYTVLVDYYDDPPAAEFADVHCKDSAMDYDAVLRITKEYGAELVISSCLDQQMNIAMKVAEELNLKHPFSSETAERVTNKSLMKRIMMDNGIPTAKYYVVNEGVDVKQLEFSGDVIVKPEDSCGSAGVSRLKNGDFTGIDRAISQACRFGLSDKVIVEEFIDGTEMGVHGYVKDGVAHILFGTCKISVIDDHMTRQLCNLYVPDLKQSLIEKLDKIINDIVKAFSLPEDTPLFMQVIVRGDDVYVIEFSPRVAGGTSSWVAEKYAGFDSISYSIDSYLGECRDEKDYQLKKYVCCFPLFSSEGVFDRTIGVDELLAKKIVDDVIVLKKHGAVISGDKPSSMNILKYIISADDYEECFSKIQKADNSTDILNDSGHSMRTGGSELTWDLFIDKLGKLI